MKTKFIFSFIVSVFSVCIFSQEIPIIKVGEKKIDIKKLSVKTEVLGDIAITTFDMQFYNPNNRVLEGELSFPLGEGQSVTRFALEINDNLRDAVVVEKEKARVAFETTVRNKIDPALLEQTKGNNYKARIYPIPAKGYKRVVLAFQQKLTVHNDAYYYKLPFNFQNELEVFSFDVTVLNQKNKPVFQKGMITDFNYNQIEDTYCAQINKKKEKVVKSILIKIPLNPKKEKVVFNENYFYFTKKIAIEKRKIALEKNITIFWDASLSQKDKKIASELSLLEMYFDKVKSCKVNLVVFNTEIRSKNKYTIKNGNWQPLKEALENIVYDGASSFSVLSKYKDGSKVNLFFTDGLNTLSGLDLNFTKKTFVINSSRSANHIGLKNLAGKSGGVYLNLNQKSIKNAFIEFTVENLQFLGTSFIEEELEVYPKKGTKITEDFSISGKGDFLNKEVKLKFGYGNTVLKTVSLKLKKKRYKNRIVKKLWAQKKLNNLLKNKKENQVAIVKLSKQYQIISPFTSMLILDRVEDYVTHKITPPKELRKQYDELIVQEVDDRKDRFIRLQKTIVSSYKDFFKWYDIDFRVKDKVTNLNTQGVIIEVEGDVILSEGEFLISGMIKSKIDDTPLPGVSIIIKGTNKGTDSDFDGNYAIKVKAGEILQFSSIGYKTLEKTIENSNGINILMFEDANELDEVVVVGYGVQRTTSVTSSSVSIVRDESLEEEINLSVENGLAGNVSGVNIDSFNDRTAENSVGLYVVDGVLVDEIPTLGSEEIASMEVLKDAASSAIYGSRGANGVIMITTKKGLKNNSKRITEFKELVKEKIELKGWDPNTPYLKQLKKTSTIEEGYIKYLELRKEYGTSPSFYIDVADFFKDKGAMNKAVQVLSNVAEIDLDNYELLKALAYKFEEYKLYDFAVYTYEEILKLRPEDVQSYRDLALVYENIGAYQKSTDLLYQIVNGEYLMKDERRRFSGVEVIALNEFNRMLHLYSSKLKTHHYNTKFIKSISLDFRVVIDWNHNDTDIDLWVIDPNKEKCFYSHKKTKIGGLMSDDMTDGFGPEQFLLKKAIQGDYKIKTKYYSDSKQKVSGPTFLKITVFKNYGTKDEIKTTQLLRLTGKDEVLDIGNIAF